LLLLLFHLKMVHPVLHKRRPG